MIILIDYIKSSKNKKNSVILLNLQYKHHKMAPLSKLGAMYLENTTKRQSNIKPYGDNKRI